MIYFHRLKTIRTSLFLDSICDIALWKRLAFDGKSHWFNRVTGRMRYCAIIMTVWLMSIRYHHCCNKLSSILDWALLCLWSVVRCTSTGAKRRLTTFSSGRLLYGLKMSEPFENGFVLVKLSNRAQSLLPIETFFKLSMTSNFDCCASSLNAPISLWFSNRKEHSVGTSNNRAIPQGSR